MYRVRSVGSAHSRIREAGDVVLTNREVLELKEQPKSLVVIGEELSDGVRQFLQQFRVRVTVIEMLPEILGNTITRYQPFRAIFSPGKASNFTLTPRWSGWTEIKWFLRRREKHAPSKAIKSLSVGRRAVTRGFGLEN